MKKLTIFKILLLSLSISSFAYAQTASILPPAKTTFLDNNGKPLTSGKVYFYTPNTLTAKTTWQNSSESVTNTNPVILDAAGRALIYGDGTYRQIVKDRNDVVIWDQVTSSTGSGSGGGSTATGDGDLVGTIKPWAGMTAPNQYAFTYGQEVSRITYSSLFTAITSAQSIFCTSASPTLTGLSDTTNFWVGMSVEVSCLAAGFSTILSKTSTTVTLAANANVTTNVTATFFPWGRGNGSTTFNLPDFRGVPIAGNNNMGGTPSSNLTTTYFGATDPNSAGALGGNQSTTLVTGNLPAYTPAGTVAITDPGHFHTALPTVFSGGGGANIAANSTGSAGSATVTTDTKTTGITAGFTGTAQGGASTAFSRVQPTRTANYIIKTTPDTNSATASGVTSLGSMTGDIACGTGLTCTGNIISVSNASSDATNVSYTAPYTDAVQQTQSNYNSMRISITDFGCVADSGTTDNGPCLRAAYDAAASLGAAIFIPPSSGYYGVTTCRNNAVFDGTSLTVANGNKSVSIYGSGWNEKPFATPSGSWILPNSAFASTCSWIRLKGTDKVTGTIYKDFAIGEFGGSLGTPKGLNGIFIDASDPAFYIQNMVIDHVYIANMAVGKSIQVTTTSSATPGGIPEATISRSKFMNFEADFLADNVSLMNNTIGQNCTNDARCVGVKFANCSGCTSTRIVGNNISNLSGMIIITAAGKPVIRDNELEMSAGFTNLNGALVDLTGSVATVDGATITGNHFSQNSAVADYAPIRLIVTTGAQIYDNRIILAKAAPYDFVSINAGTASNTFLGVNVCRYNAGASVDFNCTVSGIGPSGLQYATNLLKMPGSASGLATVGTQNAAGTPTLVWPTGSGTLASSASSPLVLSATTGALTCSTCAATGTAVSFTSVSSPIHTSTGSVTFQSNGSTFAGSISTGQLWFLGSTSLTPASGTTLTVSQNTGGTPATSAIANIIGQHIAADNTVGLVTIDTFAQQGFLASRYSNGTQASKTVVTAGQTTFSFGGQGWDGSAYGTGAALDFVATASNWSGTNHGMSAKFRTTPDATTGLAVAFTVFGSGGVSVGTAADPGINSFSAANYFAGATAGVTCNAGLSGTSRTIKGIVTTC